MSNRVRSKTINFHVTPDEYDEINARITLSGMPKAEYFIKSVLHQKIEISVGKYRSDRLALEIKKMRTALENTDETEVIVEILKQCKELLKQIDKVTTDNSIVNPNDFKTIIKKDGDEKWTKK